MTRPAQRRPGRSEREDDATITVRVPEAKDLPRHVMALFDDDDELLDIVEVAEGRAKAELPDRLRGQPVNVLVAPLDESVERPTIERMRRALAHEERLILGRDTVLTLDPERFRPLWRNSCCRVTGRVFARVTLPDGTTDDRPLCNARVVICEVDRSFRRIVDRLPYELVYRLRDDLVEAIANPPHDHMATATERVLRAGLREAFESRHEPAQVEAHAHASGDPVVRLKQLKTLTDFAHLRAEIAGMHEILRPYWRCLDWLEPFYRVDCIDTVTVDEDGNFDTEITYPCRGDRPDLYFKVEQDCHPGGWLTVHAPPVHCNVHWDYCCGTPVAIQVTHPKVVTGRSHHGCPSSTNPTDPSNVGSWELLSYNSGVFVVHAALLPNGKVLLFSGTAEINLPTESRVWDPGTGTMTTQDFAEDLFCAGHALLPDGRILVNGGAPSGANKSTHIFDPSGTGSWTKVADMKFPRWYPTTLTLPDGRIITFSGAGGAAKIEVYDVGADAWTEIVPAVPRALEIYPSLHVMPDGKILYTGTRWAGGLAWPNPPGSALFDVVAAEWTDVGPHVIPNRTEGMSVLLPPRTPTPVIHEHEDAPRLPAVPPSLTRVLVYGGPGANVAESRSAEVIDMADAAPAWRRVGDTTHARVNTNAVILPDGKVLACAGIEGFKWGPNTASLAAELYDPDAEVWTPMASMSAMRQYHSVALLLPDGRVLSTGSVSAGGNQMSMEVYSPPYLFRGPRPTVNACPAAVGYGDDFVVGSPASCRVDRVTLVRCSTITHHTNTDQRLLPLTWHREGHCDLRVTAPANGNVAPPGYYLLFVLDDCGVPSVGRFVRIN